MNIEHTNDRLTTAWLLAYRLRCCPPQSVLTGPPSPELLSHLAICPSCRADREHPFPAPDFAVTETKDSLPSPSPGELWSLRQELGGWGPKHRYFNPPVVLVTRSAGPEAVNVVQVYSDPTLAGPGDIFPGREISGFAEPWNRYTVAVQDLGTCLNRVSGDVIDMVQQAGASEEPYSLPPGSLLWFFRQMEVETGYFFASRTIARLMDLEAGGNLLQKLAYRDPEELLASLSGFPLHLPEKTDTDIPRTLAMVTPADDLLALAAATRAPEEIQPLLFTVEKGQIVKVEAVSATITALEFRGGILSVTGTCELWAREDCTWIFHWQSEKGITPPLAGQHGAREGIFWVAFDGSQQLKKTEGRLVVRILHHR